MHELEPGFQGCCSPPRPISASHHYHVLALSQLLEVLSVRSLQSAESPFKHILIVGKAHIKKNKGSKQVDSCFRKDEVTHLPAASEGGSKLPQFGKTDP